MKKLALFLLFVGIVGFSAGFLTMMRITVPHYQMVLGKLHVTNIHVMSGAFVAAVIGFIMTVTRG